MQLLILAIKMFCVNVINSFANKILYQNTILRGSLTSFCVTSYRNKSSCEPDWAPATPKIHTGQQWAKDDYRLARFVGRPQQINEQFAIDLISKVPPIACKERIVCCDGGDDLTGHPRVYINLDKPGNHICGYCGLRFYKDQGH